MNLNQTKLHTTTLFIFFILVSNICFGQDNTPPSLIGQINNQIINEDQLFRLELNLNEVFSDESALSFSINKKNADWLTNVGDSILVGFPLQEHVGEYTIDINATDDSGNSSSTSFTINVVFVDDKPIIIKNLPGQLQRPGFGEIKIGYKETFYEEEDDALTYEVQSSYPAVAIAELVGDSILITEKGIGPAEIILTATDNYGNETEAKMFIRIFEEADILNMTTANTGSNSLANSRVTCVRNDYAGNIWVGYENEISRYKDGKWEQFQFEIPFGDIIEIWDDNNGNIFFISTYTILKYNGQEFTYRNIDGELDTPQFIRASYVTPDSTLFITGYDEEFQIIVSKYNGYNWETVYREDREDTLPLIYNLCIDQNNNIWIANKDGLYLINDSIRSNFTVENNISGRIYDVEIDIHGNIWFITRGNIYEYNQTFDIITTYYGWNSNCVYADDIGTIWVGELDCRLRRIKENKIELFTFKDPLPDEFKDHNNTINNIFKTNDGRYWFLTSYGLYITENYSLRDESTIIQNTFDGLPSNEIFDLIRDKDGVYWINTFAGMSTYNGNKWNYYGRTIMVHSIDDNGRKLCETGNLFNNPKTSFTIIDETGEEKTYPHNVTGIENIHDIISDKDNNIWIAGNGGLAKFDGSSWTKYNNKNGLLSDRVWNIFSDSGGNIWIEYVHLMPEWDYGISKFNGDIFVHYTESDGLADKSVNEFIEDKYGNIWIGTINGGLSKYNEDTWTTYTKHSGLKANYIQSLGVDFTGGIWISYDHNDGFGVSRFDGTKFDHFTTDDGLPTNKIKHIYVDHALTNQNKSASIDDVENAGLIWLGSKDKGAANFYLQNATSVVDRSLPKMQAMLFPNPTQGITNILLDNQPRKYLEIEILAIDGKKVHTERRTDLYGKVQLNLSELSSGTYLLKITSDIDSTVKKVVIN